MSFFSRHQNLKELSISEVLSSLLFPATMESVRNQGYGGVAAVDVLGQGDELLIGVWLNATMVSADPAPRYVLISLEKDDGRRKQLQTLRSELITKVSSVIWVLRLDLIL